MAGKPKNVEDDQRSRLKALLAAANARYRTLLRNRDTSAESGRALNQVLEIERQIALLDHRTGPDQQGAPQPGCCPRCGAKLPETRWKVVYEQPPCDRLTPEQEDEVLSRLLLHRGEREGTPEVLLAAIARTVSELDHDPLPAELELQVRELLDLYLEGNQKEEA